MRDVSIDDSFFDLGGNSLLATKLISRIRSSFEAEVGVQAVFTTPTVAGLSQVVHGALRARPPLERRPRPGTLPVSFAQQRLWFLNRLDSQRAVYNSPFVWDLSGPLDIEALKEALVDVVTRHESLRTVFPDSDGEPCQVILPAPSAANLLTAINVAADQLAGAVAKLRDEEFDLTADIPVRVYLLSSEATTHTLVLLIHHIAADGWSRAPLLRDLRTAYEARLAGRCPQWAELPVQYADYALWQRELLGSSDRPESLLTRQLAYWTAALEGLPEELNLPLDRPRPAKASYTGDIVHFHLPDELYNQILDLAHTSNTTVFMVLQAALSTLLLRLGAGPDIPLGTPIAGRMDDALDDLVGFFVNTLVLRTDLSDDPSFRELLARVRRIDLEAFDHQELPFERLVEELNPSRSLARHPLFQTMLTLHNTEDHELELPNLQITESMTTSAYAKFDLDFEIAEKRGGDGKSARMDGLIIYSCDLFDRGTVQLFANYFARLLDHATTDPDVAISGLRLLSLEERRQQVRQWNGMAAEGDMGDKGVGARA